MKYFRMSYEEVVFNRSYANIILLNRSIPSFNTDKDKENRGGKDDEPVKIGKSSANGNDLFASLM